MELVDLEKSIVEETSPRTTSVISRPSQAPPSTPKISTSPAPPLSTATAPPSTSSERVHLTPAPPPPPSLPSSTSQTRTALENSTLKPTIASKLNKDEHETSSARSEPTSPLSSSKNTTEMVEIHLEKEEERSTSEETTRQSPLSEQLKEAMKMRRGRYHWPSRPEERAPTVPPHRENVQRALEEGKTIFERNLHYGTMTPNKKSLCVDFSSIICKILSAAFGITLALAFITLLTYVFLVIMGGGTFVVKIENDGSFFTSFSMHNTSVDIVRNLTDLSSTYESKNLSNSTLIEENVAKQLNFSKTFDPSIFFFNN